MNNKNFSCIWEIAKYKLKQFNRLNQQLEQIFNINVWHNNLNYLNSYFDFNGENYFNNKEAFKILKLQITELLAFLKEEHDAQQKSTQCLSRRKSFEQFYDNKNIFNIIKVKVSRNWLEQQHLCQFDQTTGQLIINKTNFEKLWQWTKANIAFAKNHMCEKLNTTDGFLGANLSFNKIVPEVIIFSIPILEEFSKSLKSKYKRISHNKQFGNKYDILELQDSYIKYINQINSLKTTSSIKNQYLWNQLKNKKLTDYQLKQVQLIKQESILNSNYQVTERDKTLNLEDIKN